MIGHIKIDRKILNWEWYNDYRMVHLFLHLLLKANWADCNWRGQTIHRGQLMTSLAKLSGNTGLSVSQIRTCLKKLQNTGEIANEMTNSNTLITICKYDVYQSEKKQDSTQISKHIGKRDNKRDDTPFDTPDSNNIRIQEDKENKKVFIQMPLPENFNGLPEMKIGAVIQLLKITKQVDVTNAEVNGLWEIFKIQNLTGSKFYKDEDDVYSHFINWSKNHKIEKNGANKQRTGENRFTTGADNLISKGTKLYNELTGK